jgi:phosphoglycerate dehydrogenase-like enzyme
MSLDVWMRDRPQRDAIGPLPAGVELHLLPDDDGPPPPELLDAQFVVPPFDSPAVLHLLAQMPRLAIVQSISAGTEALAPWVPEGVTLCSARGVRDVAVAEWVLAAILAMEKRLPEFMRRQADHEWTHELVQEIAGKRALVVGYGSIGRCLGERLTALGVQVEGVAAVAREGVHGTQELPALLGTADVVVLLVPLTPDTHGMFDSAMLSRMRPGALLVNAARGSVVDTEALLAQLQAGRIRAALDVTDPEPLPRDHELWDAPGLLLTPHLAGDSPQAEHRLYRFIGEQIRRYARGEALLNVVQG